jgi:hypothetical protein
VLERGANDLDDLIDRLAERVGDLRLVELDLARHPAPDIAPADERGEAIPVAGPDRRPDLQLDPLGRALADQ